MTKKGKTIQNNEAEFKNFFQELKDKINCEIVTNNFNENLFYLRHKGKNEKIFLTGGVTGTNAFERQKFMDRCYIHLDYSDYFDKITRCPLRLSFPKSEKEWNNLIEGIYFYSDLKKNRKETGRENFYNNYN